MVLIPFIFLFGIFRTPVAFRFVKLNAIYNFSKIGRNALSYTGYATKPPGESVI